MLMERLTSVTFRPASAPVPPIPPVAGDPPRHVSGETV